MDKERKKLKVLVVEDENLVREALSSMLEQKGFISEEARNGKEVLAKVVKDMPDIIILDLMMPVMNGSETYSKLKENPKTRDIPIIICSALPISDFKKDNIEVEGYLEKPFSIRELCEKINEVLGL